MLQLLLSVIDAVPVRAVNHKYQAISALIVKPPKLADLVLATCTARVLASFRVSLIIVLSGAQPMGIVQGIVCSGVPYWFARQP